MDIKQIKNEADYEAALKEIDRLMDAKPDTPEGDQLDVLTTLVEAWEQKHHRIEDPDPIEAILHRMEALGLARKDLEPTIGTRARVSEVLSRKRPLTINMIRRLNKEMRIPVDPSDPTTLESEGRSYDDYTQFLNEQALRGARIGVGRDFFGGNPEIDALIEAAIQVMRGLGATIIESVRFEEEFLSFIARTGTGLRGRINAEFKPALEDYLATLDDGYPRTLADIIGIYESPQVMHSALPVNPGLIALHKRNLAIGGLDNPGYIKAIESDLPMVRRTVLEIMERDDLDALVFPTSRCPTGTLHTVEEDVGRVCERGRSATNLSSYSGFPDIQVPAGFTSGGLPTTISFLGRAFSEPELLGFAFAFEQATRHWRLSPLVPPLTGEAFDY